MILTNNRGLARLAAHSRGNHFKENIIDAFYHGMAHRPDSTFGTVNDDVPAFKNPKFELADFCKIILNSAWRREISGFAPLKHRM